MEQNRQLQLTSEHLVPSFQDTCFVLYTALLLVPVTTLLLSTLLRLRQHLDMTML